MPRRRQAPERPYASFEVVDLASAVGQKILQGVLLPKQPKGLAPYSVWDHILGSGGANNPLVQTVIIESNYVDRDHGRAHESFFVRSFRDIPRKTTRIHFFSSRFTRRSLPKLDKQAESYLGFCVIRPLSVRNVGRTVVPVSADPNETVFVTTRTTTRVNVAGFALEAAGPPFLEQDERVSRCATAALWTATTALADHVQLPRYTTAEITTFGNRYYAEEREFASAGLYPAQMAEALRAMGYEAVSLGVPRSSEEAKALVYGYVESGVPPLLMLRQPLTSHVLTGVGHTWSGPITTPPTARRFWGGSSTPDLNFHRSSSWVPAILAHDDETGPFVRVTFESTPDNLVNEHGPKEAEALLKAGGCPVTIEKTIRFLGRTRRYTAVLAQILVPSPPRVVLTGLQAELKAVRLVNTWYVAHKLTTPQNFVLRTYLARSNDFKRWVRNSDMHPKARRLYAGKGMPRWLWVTEISEIPWMNSEADKDRLVRGEVVIDPTSSPWVPDFLTFHLIDDDINAGAGLMASMVPADEDPEDALGVPLELPGEQPYKYLGRHLGG